MDKRKGKNRIDINSNMNSNQSDDDNSDVFYEAVTDVEVSTPQNNNVFYEAVTDVEVSKPQNNRYSIFTSLSLLSNSFSISGVTKKCKIIIGNKISNFIAPEDDSYTKIIFHVHFPKVHVGDPVIVGNIEELGNWNEPKVILKQHNKKHTSYWYSDPIQIPNVRFQVTVRYKYAVYSYNNLHLEYEGSGPDDDRELDIQRQQFDIWKNNSAYRINKINDYMFLNVIYGSENIKGMILDYDRILKQHQDLTLSVTNLQFINKRVSDKSIGKRLFLCFLLGHIAANNSERFELPREFQFFPLLQAFFTVDQYTFPSDSMHVVLKGIDLLIRHNIHYGLFEWLEIFSIAKNFDPQYKFINTISFSNCNNEKYIEDCFEKILKDKFDEYHRAKIIKWLMSQCNNAKYFSIIWRSSKKSDKKLRQDLEDNIKKMISEDEPANLHKNFTQLPDDIRDKVSDLFKKRVLDLLTKDRLAIWDEPKSKSISNLLNSKRLNWTKNEYIAVLRTVSTSNDDQLLSVFPSLLKNWKEMSNGIDYQITQLCINWYKKLMNRIGRTSSNSTAHRGESIIAVLENLSRICSLINEHSILGELIGLTFGHIRRFPEESILNTASNVEKFSSEAVHVFTKVIEEKIDSMELDRFIPLLNKMQVICGSTGKSLKIPNEYCEKTLLYIMSSLPKNSSKPFSETSLREYAEFWIVILRATGSTKKFHSHQLVQETRATILGLADMIKNSSINVHLLQQLLKLDDDFLYVYLNSANFNNDKIISKDNLVKVRQNCDFYEQRLKKLDNFYKRFCPLQKTKDVQSYLDELRERSKNLNKISLKEFLSEAHWSFHKRIISIAERTYELNQSRTFNNVLKIRLNEESDEESEEESEEESDDMSVEFIAQTLMNVVLEEYAARCKQYENWENLKSTEEIPFWCDVSNFDDEIRLMEKYGNIRINKNEPFMVTIGHLSRNKFWKQRTGNLSKITEIFKVKENWLDNLIDHGNLGTFSNTVKIINQKFSKYNENNWNFIKELSRSEELIKFLEGKTDDDLKFLINGVDEHSDTRLIQEGTITSLIQVKQFLHPFMNNDHITMDTLIGGFNYINLSLASKLSLCNCNVMALKNMYDSVYNKGDVTKEKIQNAASHGTYDFKKEEDEEDCKLELSYPSKSETMKFKINELQELRSRALLISKPGVSIDDIDDIKVKMEEFVNQFDIAQRIITIMKKLTQLGHFGYRKYNESAKGTCNLEKLAIRLRNDLDIWENMVNRAQENCYYLTFYPSRHILAFYDYYTENSEQYKIKEETCQTLVSFVNRNAKLPQLKDQWLNYEKDKYEQALEKINHKLGRIFGTLQKHERPVKNSEGRVMSDIVKCGELFIAACKDKSKVPNIIMSLNVNHGFYPEPWQLLICFSSTTEEELSIFIKRCFFASKNGYEGHLFCIANLELLEFELQFFLVNKIKFFTEQVKDYYLALICCSETGMHHHIVDQFSKYVHETAGLDDVAMKAIYRELCPKVTCISSELSGQGKTRFIEHESSKCGKNLVPFLISDEASYNSLIRQLRNSNIQQDNDSLHINIISANNPEQVNIFLFQLLSLGIILNNADITSLPDTYIFIEIAGNHLFKSLPFLSCLDNRHLVWNIDRLMVPVDIYNPIQVVCRYLDIYDRKELDKENILYQTNDDNVEVPPLDQEPCQQLLDKYFFKKVDPSILSFRFLEIFVNVLSDQLLRLSGSSFFTVENLEFMTNDIKIRSTLFNTLLDVSKYFATKSTKTKSAQLHSIAKVNQLENIVQWDDSNHLLVFFMSQSPESISALYRNKNIVPHNVLNLLKSQRWELVDYQTMTSDRLLSILECLARNTMHKIDYQPYALSADNLLKMALMLLRTRANIPVVICGEAGCGKTSLISFLAKVVEVECDIFNLHAGVAEVDIKNFIKKSGKKAETSEIWLFFDEINTCNHIGLLAELIAHRRLDGKPIHQNIRLFAACNPYRIRNKSIKTVGLKPKKVNFENQSSSLVYAVKPLPDQILDYVWDYGTLQPKDEKSYIQIMVQEAKLSSIFAELIFASQEFIRNVEEPYSVSLRDVKRAIKLVDFFYKSLLIRKDEKRKYPYPDNSLDIFTRSYVLALGLCYQSRLYENDLRWRYRERMCKILNMKEARFKKIIREEQLNYMDRMTCPPNTAFNEALLENVLAAIVCIMCKIPLFIVGAPGSSKSLAIRLVNQNLRGLDSNNSYFKTLPHAFFIHHQGSSSSTSDGIEKVFKKAEAYQKTSSKEFPIISVVLLDEVGLAEISPYNPLKVLHSLLEPSYPADGPAVSVIGISNWRLDNSKNSRALLVQRPNFDSTDLVAIASCLLDPAATNAPLISLAQAYSDYEANGQQAFPNFHGLRDYYALVKILSNKAFTPENVYLAILRNFGGIKELTENCLKYFSHFIDSLNGLKIWTHEFIPIDYLINENLESKDSRHLMVIGNSDSLVNILLYQLYEKNLEPVVILGSQFPEDRDDYSYNTLSKIMICVEAGRPLILTDLESIYGSLYDLWNQNYITSGSSDNPKYFTRVALGAYANPMLHIHPDFKCILVLDEKKLENADSPLLNRFEKQCMTMDDILEKDEKELVNKLREWILQISTMEGTSGTNFTVEDSFIGFNDEETLQSIVISMRGDLEILEKIEKCKENLIAIATPDGMVRMESSALGSEQIQHWKTVYFQVQHHNDLADYFQNLLQRQKVKQDGHLVIINTFSNINTDVNSCLEGISECSVLKLSTFKTESQFQKQVYRFWFESDNELLVLQCDISIVNANCIKLAKFIIEQCRNKYLQKRENNARKIKHACIILHTHREKQQRENKEENVNITSFNFMSEWNQITIESLTKQQIKLSDLLIHDWGEIFNTIYPFEEILSQELLWCLLCVKYPNNVNSIKHVECLSKSILKHPNFVNCLKIRTLEWFKTNIDPEWKFNIASTKQFYPHSSFAVALQAFIRTKVRSLVAKMLYSLERLGATESFLIHDKPQSRMSPHNVQQLKFWKEMFMDNNVINIDSLPEPKPDIYSMPISVFDLQFPFSLYFMKKIDSFKTLYAEEISILRRETHFSHQIYEKYNQKFSKKIIRSITLLDSSFFDDPDLYFKDFIYMIYSNENLAKNMSVLSYIFKCKLGEENITNPILLHIFWWNNASSTLATFQLIHECPLIFNEIMMNNEELIYTENIEQYIVNEVSSLMLKKLSNSQDIVELQLEIRNVLNLCGKLSDFKTTESFQLLQFFNELLSNELIPMEIIREIIVSKGSDELFSTNYICRVFNILKDIKDIEPNDILLYEQSFIMKGLEIVPFDSFSKLEFYHTLFLKDPFPLMGQIIKNIFEKENKHIPFEFFTWLDNSSETQNSLSEIMNSCLEKKGCHSSIATLFCDIIQKTFFAKYNILELSPYYCYAIEALYTDNVAGSRKITAIAFLKEFVHKFWNALNLGNILRPIELDYRGFDSAIIELINQINRYMSFSHKLIDSLKIYFLRDLHDRGYSMIDVQKFCQAQNFVLPWLENLPWGNHQENRLLLNVYSSYEDYCIIEDCFTLLFSYNNQERFNQYFENINQPESIIPKIVLMGGILNRLHIIRATREWSREENQAAKLLNEKIGNTCSLSNIYKSIIEKIVTNQYSILQLDTNASNSDLLIKSVIGHVIALHSSIAPNASPLAYLLYNLGRCNGLFILTCPSDAESMFHDAIGNFTRYKCKCGNIYLIGDCGRAYERSTCPYCKNSIGGVSHTSDPGNEKLDASPITAEKGYIGENVNGDIKHNLRDLNPIPYRILHLFVHSIIGAWAPSDTATSFLQKNNNIPNNSLEYCKRHIMNDWGILIKQLNCSEENLALLLHAILDKMLQAPKNSSLNSPEQRKSWEKHFEVVYVKPLITNITNTANEFRIKLAKNQRNSSIIEEEIKQTIPMDERYIHERLPSLWRSIGEMSFQGLNAYYNSDIEKHKSRFPFMSVFFKFSDKLEKLKFLWPIVNFVNIITSHLENRISREKANEISFEQFINYVSNDGKSEERLKFIMSNFNNFTFAWNSVIDDVNQFQCHELQKPKPKINLKSPIALALVEPKDSGVYLCAILEYLIRLQNNFLQEVIKIPIRSTRALKFLEESNFIQETPVSSTNSNINNANSAESPTSYYLQSLRIDQTKQNNFINYTWDDDILQNSDRNLEVGRGHDIIYYLQNIEMELARRLVFEKVHISTLNDSQAYMEPFTYHMELFKEHTRILEDIKSLIHQQKIPSDKIPLIIGVVPTSATYSEYHNNSLSYENASELLSSLEILLCFVKRTSVGNEETKILDYVNQWMKLSVLTNKFKYLSDIGLCLKHLVNLYELIEEQIANHVIRYMDGKFNIELTNKMMKEIDSTVDFERTSTTKERIPAEAFVLALKRFVLRFLKNFDQDQHPLSCYITIEGLNLWPDEISDESLENFPRSLLICHIYAAYVYVNSKIKVR